MTSGNVNWALVRTVQFNLCKLHSVVLQYVLTGLVGNNGRVQKARPSVVLNESDRAEDASDEDADILDGLRCEQRKRPR